MTTTLNVADRRRATLERQQRRRPHGRPAQATRRTARVADRRPDRVGPAARIRALLGTDATPPTADRRALGPPPGTFYVIAAVVSVFVMFGLVMVLSASAVTQANIGNSPYAVFSRQALWAGLGLAGMIVATRVPYTVWKPLSIPLGLLGVAAMCSPFVPGLGVTINGARSWVRIGSLSVQPSEFLKVVAVIAAADLLTRRAGDLHDHRRTLLPVAVLAGAVATMSLVQGDLGSAVVLGAIVLSVAWVAGVPLIPLSMLTTAAAMTAIGFVMSSPRRLSRFTAFLNIEAHKDLESYQVWQGMVSMANGGLTGSGIGGSRGKLGYLPYAHSDFIFAIIVDELGMIGTAAVIGGFIVLVAFGIQTALAAPDRFGMLLAGGISAWFGVQAIVNLGGVTGVLPVTGLTLPFFSAGGTSLFVSMFAAGLLLSVARRAVRH
ncbi:MAG: cell division protein FtsW [Ilumatobacter sp.]|nr:cell division protein FtsW [Ilumatobacter sp.]